MCGWMCSWSEWIEEIHNNQVWVHDKRLYRYCTKCGKSESKVIRIDCTHFRRTGKYCSSCLSIINENRKLDNVPILEYNEVNRNIMNMAGRKPNIRMIRNTQKYREQGMTYREIAKKTRRGLKIVHFWANYPIDKAEKRLSIKRA